MAEGFLVPMTMDNRTVAEGVEVRGRISTRWEEEGREGGGARFIEFTAALVTH